MKKSNLVRTYRAFAFVTAYDDPRLLPSLSSSKAECLSDWRSGFGHPCDNPTMRGVIAEVEVIVRLPKAPPINNLIQDYVANYEGIPGILEVGNTAYNRKAIKEAKQRQKAAIKRIKQ